MKIPRREFSIFTLSALDVLAVATGVFVLLLVYLMPYYRKTMDEAAALDGVEASVEQTADHIAALDGARESESVALADMTAEAEALKQAVAAAESRLAAASLMVRTNPRAATADRPHSEDIRADVDRRVVKELDLVFVIDRTASMSPVLRELAASMRGIVRILERLVPSVRIGLVAYSDRDTGLPPLKSLPLTATASHKRRILEFVDRLDVSPRSSLTVEEDLFLGLSHALSMPFRRGARQALIVIGDAAAHPPLQTVTLTRARDFVKADINRTISALFVTTPTSLYRGNVDRGFFRAIAESGRGEFSDHAGRMIESVLLSILVE